jgi:hypothetical protein
MDSATESLAARVRHAFEPRRAHQTLATDRRHLGYWSAQRVATNGGRMKKRHDKVQDARVAVAPMLGWHPNHLDNNPGFRRTAG